MGGNSSKSYPGNIVPMQVKEVTTNCIAQLKVMPLARANEGYLVPTDTLTNQLIPQTNESIFLNWYVTERILNNSNILELTRPSTNIFTNYSGRIFEVEENGAKQLLLVGVSIDLDFDPDFTSGPLRSLPFLIYIPPSPQDTPSDHRKLRPDLYSKTKDDDIPMFYKDTSNYPYSWDWLYFQFFLNMYKISHQLKKANKPYVFVVPLVKNFGDGIGFLNSGTLLEKCLLGIQKFYLDEKLKDGNYTLGDLKHITFASFSIGDSILSNFILQNRENPFFRDKVKDLIVLDPPYGNPNNRSPIIDSIISIMRTDANKSVFLYTQDSYYIQLLIKNVLIPKGIPFDLSKNKIFSDPKVKNVFFAYLEAAIFKADIQDRVIKSVHNTFPNLFINNAVSRSSLTFIDANGKLRPNYNFLSWAPHAE